MNENKLRLLQGLSLELKIARSKNRIMDWICYHGRDNIYISFSGGKDSTVLAHLVRSVEYEMYGNSTIPLVFCDTGLEFPELREFALKQKNVVALKPALTHPQVIKKYGYPVASKTVSSSIRKLREQNLTDKYRNYLLNGDERGKYGMIPKKWQFLKDVDFNVGAGCCDVMKKRPFHKYERITGRNAPFTGELASESRLRKTQYLKFGCNAFDRKAGFKSTPIATWINNDILEYIDKFNLKIASVYGDIKYNIEQDELGQPKKIYYTTGENRTGCVFCLYGIDLEKGENRIQRLSKTHPKMYDYCTRGGRYDEDGIFEPHQGLGLSHIMDSINVEWRPISLKGEGNNEQGNGDNNSRK